MWIRGRSSSVQMSVKGKVVPGVLENPPCTGTSPRQRPIVG